MKSLKRNMSTVRTEYVPWFDSQPGPSQGGGEPQPEETMDRTEPPSEGRRGKRGNKQKNVRGEKTRFVFKVKLPKLNKVTNEEDKTPRRWMLEPAANKTKTAQSRGQGAAADSDSVGGDVFFFSQRTSSKTINEKEKAKLTVLRTISKVLEENQLIRQRLSALSQAQ